MKKIVALILTSYSCMVLADTLDTPHFTVEITCHSTEYNVGCDSVTYKGTSKKTGETIQLEGKQLMKMCADGVTPCHSLGYEFYNGGTRYLVTDNGQLIVSQGDKIILQEEGQWQNE